MKFSVCSVQFFVFGFVVLAAVCLGKEPKRSKLSTIYALTPSLRVGRRSEGSWDPSGEMKHKFAKVMSFPRVAQRTWLNENIDDLEKRTGGNTGMWFGPRLGRLQKRDTGYDHDYYPWTYLIMNNDNPMINRQVHYTPRLGRESEEMLDFPEQDGSNPENSV